ncbi:MAG: hypothetical protein RLZZ244_1350 [Verrucomicrobiota bacterium]
MTPLPPPIPAPRSAGSSPRALSLALALALSPLPFEPHALAQSVYYTTAISRIIEYPNGHLLKILVNPEQQFVQETLVDKSKKILWRLVRELDEDGQPLRGTKYDGNDRILSKHRYLCLLGRLEEEEVFDVEDRFRAKFIYHYDKKGRINRRDEVNASGKIVSSKPIENVDPVVLNQP